MLHVPEETTVNVAVVVFVESDSAPSVHTAMSLLVKVFCSDAELVEVMLKAATPYTRSDKVSNVIVWVPLFMVSTASADVTVETAPALPKLFVTTEYVPASASTKLEIVYDDDVAPEIFTPSLRHW